MEKHLSDVRHWGVVYLFVADGVLTKVEQILLADVLGEDVALKTIEFLREVPGDVAEMAAKRFHEACAGLEAVGPREREILAVEFDRIAASTGETDEDTLRALQLIRQTIRFGGLADRC